jgi:hypothetical protein
MTARGVVLPLAIAAALGLAACAKHDNTPSAAAPPPAESTGTQAPVRTASADDPDAAAREEGFASAAEQARARANGEEPAEPAEPR